MITDHAVLRYLERAKGLDTSAIRDEMEALIQRADVGPHGFVADGLTFVIEQGRVVTVLSPEQRPKKGKKARLARMQAELSP